MPHTIHGTQATCFVQDDPHLVLGVDLDPPRRPSSAVYLHPSFGVAADEFFGHSEVEDFLHGCPTERPARNIITPRADVRDREFGEPEISDGWPDVMDNVALIKDSRSFVDWYFSVYPDADPLKPYQRDVLKRLPTTLTKVNLFPSRNTAFALKGKPFLIRRRSDAPAGKGSHGN